MRLVTRIIFNRSSKHFVLIFTSLMIVRISVSLRQVASYFPMALVFNICHSGLQKNICRVNLISGIIWPRGNLTHAQRNRSDKCPQAAQKRKKYVRYNNVFFPFFHFSKVIILPLKNCLVCDKFWNKTCFPSKTLTFDWIVKESPGLSIYMICGWQRISRPEFRTLYDYLNVHVYRMK